MDVAIVYCSNALKYVHVWIHGHCSLYPLQNCICEIWLQLYHVHTHGEHSFPAPTSLQEKQIAVLSLDIALDVLLLASVQEGRVRRAHLQVAV